MKKLGQFLRARRVALSLDQSSLARQLGVESSYLSALERGKRRPSLKLIRRLADALEVDRQELLFVSYPEATRLVARRNHAQPGKRTKAWLSFIKDRKLLARYHVTAAELHTFAPVLAGIWLSPKQYLTALVLMRDTKRLKPKAQPSWKVLVKDGAHSSSQSPRGAEAGEQVEPAEHPGSFGADSQSALNVSGRSDRTSRHTVTAKDEAAPILTVQSVAGYLGVSPTMIYRLLKRKELPAFKVGRDWRFRRESIDHWRSEAERRGSLTYYKSTDR